MYNKENKTVLDYIEKEKGIAVRYLVLTLIFLAFIGGVCVGFLAYLFLTTI